MHRSHGRRGHRRRTTIAVFTAATTIAAVLAAMGPAASVARHAGGSARAVPRANAFDFRAAGAAISPSARTIRARVALARSLGTQGVIESDPVTGTLRMVGRLDGYLTGRSNRRGADVAMGYVQAHLAAFGLTKADLKTFHLRQDYVDVGGTHHLSWVQSTHGISVFHNGLRANVTRSGQLVNLTGSPVHGLRANTYRPTVSADAAMRVARGTAGMRTPQSHDSATLVLFPTGRGARLAWRTLTWATTQELDLSVVDATDGTLLYRQNLTDRDTAAPPPTEVAGTGSAWEFYPSDQVPLGANVQQPVTFQVFSPSPVPTIDSLFGPNALVWDDVKDDNKIDPGESVPAVSGTDWSVPAILDSTTTAQNCDAAHPCTWDSTAPFSWKANETQNAAQLFYYLNKYHDHLLSAPYGFDEAAGNFQWTNTSGQGVGGDPVLGNADDGANSSNGLPDKNHFDNANMSTPPDGTPPTMQMYLFQATKGLERVPSANGGDDAEVVYHEYTHGLTNREVTYPDGTSGLTTQQSASMGEGWSDWYAEDFMNNQGFKPDTAAIGDVVMGAISFAGELRTNAVDCPVGGVATTCPGGAHTGPGGYTYGDFGKILSFGPEVHADGEIWLETLWDLRQTLGATTAETLVTRALELSPPAPSYLDMRNAIVQADIVNFGGANQAAIWTIFANRGMGYFASSTDGSDVTPTEDFSIPPDCSTTTCVTLSGKLTDKLTGKPAKGVDVAVAGLNSGFGFDLADTTDSAGRFSIANMPVHSYPEIRISGGGYEPVSLNNVNIQANTSVNRALVRDWASIEGGAKPGKFTPPDYSGFGCGPAQALDLNLGTGWGSDAVNSTSGSHHKGPRNMVVKLPKAVDISSFGLASFGACGDPPKAGVKDFEIRTKTAGGPWITAFTGVAPSNDKLMTYVPKTGTDNVRYVQLIMLSNHGDRLFMDLIELSVRGR